MRSVNQENFIRLWNFASKAHAYQKVPASELPYLTHIGLVVMEVMAVSDSIEDIELALSCAILHDTIEDTDIGYEDIVAISSKEIADGVLALTKNSTLETKSLQMLDSLERIKKQKKSLWAVKLADRISNLQAPPSHWSTPKIKAYLEESKVILETLGSCNETLSMRLEDKIKDYEGFFQEKM
jgi:(p)ppGpp synthase/HD superfamily hydrolase